MDLPDHLRKIERISGKRGMIKSLKYFGSRRGNVSYFETEIKFCFSQKDLLIITQRSVRW